MPVQQVVYTVGERETLRKSLVEVHTQLAGLLKQLRGTKNAKHMHAVVALQDRVGDALRRL